MTLADVELFIVPNSVFSDYNRAIIYLAELSRNDRSPSCVGRLHPSERLC